MHAKCVVADDRSVFVSSANFTEAAQELENVEIGLLIESVTGRKADQSLFHGSR